MEEAYQRTVERQNYIESQGITVETLWECEYKEQLAADQEMRDYVDSLQLVDPLNGRDAFFGGR